jgi:N-acetylglucosaminyldiphosphoundecaprenol N-acetyl-beta-D-mannosaminyltransferase
MKIFWINLTNISSEKLFINILSFKNRSIIFTPNPEILLKIKNDKDFKKLLKKANFLLPDGIWIFLAYQILNSKQNSKIINILKLPFYIFNLFFRRKYLYQKYWERICGSDLTKKLLENFNKTKEKITIIDLYNPSDENKVKSQKVFRQKLKKVYPNLNIDYFIYNNEKKQKIIENIRKSKTRVLFSTLWMKKQEKSVIEITQKCDSIKLALAVWSSFDYFIWFQKRAPDFIRKIWFEWLYRLFTWPRKINRLKRLYSAIILFILEIIKSK